MKKLNTMTVRPHHTLKPERDLTRIFSNFPIWNLSFDENLLSTQLFFMNGFLWIFLKSGNWLSERQQHAMVWSAYSLRQRICWHITPLCCVASLQPAIFLRLFHSTFFLPKSLTKLSSLKQEVKLGLGCGSLMYFFNTPFNYQPLFYFRSSTSATYF